MLTHETKTYLLNKGITKIEVEFSGGNDEGGTDALYAYDKDGNTVDLKLDRVYFGTRYNKDGTRTKVAWIDGKEITPDDLPTEHALQNRVAEELEQPIYDRYGSFAGEFHVYGSLSWDVATGKARMNGQESVETYDDFSEEF